MSELIYRKLDLVHDKHSLINLFKTSWPNDPINNDDFFDWQLRAPCFGEAIGFTAEPSDRQDILAGVYLVLPSFIQIKDKTYSFSISMYTITHPDYFRRGIFKKLANLTYKECVSKNIIGTVGVPNNNSLHGFSKGLGFEVIGQFDVYAKPVSAFKKRRCKNIVRVICEKDLSKYRFDFFQNMSKKEPISLGRGAEFIKWRFLHNPLNDFAVFIALQNDYQVSAIMVARKAWKKKIPMTVIMDFFIDRSMSLEDAEEVGCALLSEVNSFALKSLTPVITTLLNPNIFEAKILAKLGFLRLPKKIQPHDSNFILKIHKTAPNELRKKLSDFTSWHFTFADFDIF